LQLTVLKSVWGGFMPHASYFPVPLLVLVLTVLGCAGPEVSNAPSADAMADPVRVTSDDLDVALIKIAEQGNKGTLIQDCGWREYVIEIENISSNAITRFANTTPYFKCENPSPPPLTIRSGIGSLNSVKQRLIDRTDFTASTTAKPDRCQRRVDHDPHLHTDQQP